jgi:hypothetical protein
MHAISCNAVFNNIPAPHFAWFQFHLASLALCEKPPTPCGWATSLKEKEGLAVMGVWSFSCVPQNYVYFKPLRTPGDKSIALHQQDMLND